MPQPMRSANPRHTDSGLFFATSGKTASDLGLQAAPNRGRDVSSELAGAKDDIGEIMAVANVGQEGEDAGGHCIGKQDGTNDLGHVDKRTRLSESGGGCCCMTSFTFTPGRNDPCLHIVRPTTLTTRITPVRENLTLDPT